MSALSGFGSWRHLAGRFFGALSPASPPPADEAWALGALLEGEQGLWRRMSGPDRRHAVSVARDTVRLLGPGEQPREVIAAALLHDVGKVESGLGTFSRVAVTVAAIAVSRDRLLGWADVSGRASTDGSRGRLSPRARVGLYLTHDRVGARLLEAAGSEEMTATWAREHHLDPARWTVEARVGAALKTADGD